MVGGDLSHGGKVEDGDHQQEWLSLFHPDFIERELMRLCEEVLLDYPKTVARLSEDEKIPIVAEQVAISHSELMLIHPFREGNGRLGRWIADLMVLQAGLRIPAYNLSTEANRQNYFRALRRGFAGDFTEIVDLYGRWIRAGQGQSA